MTVINLTALERLLEAPGPIAEGEVTVDYWAGRGPVTVVDGADVVFPSRIRVGIVDGVLVAPLDVPGTGGVACARVRVASKKGPAVTRFVEIPDVGPVDFGDLVVVDPVSFAPTPQPPSLIALIDQRIALFLESNPLYPSDGGI
ncbi:hypothetical protein ACSBPH_01515 [Microbacterium sp. F51-2R]|uniref:hypothetical protein n=1 Tax=Microbacterium sp. F51-2R TaxID=3445777 RepID=UPI003FA0FA65